MMPAAESTVRLGRAGGMLEEELTAYIHATRERTPGLTLGFHGHNNLGLANANSYTAWREGCTFVDSSMMGLGRSSGNAITEQLVAIFVRAGIPIGIDPIAALDVAEKLVRPIFPSQPPTSLDITAGLALFHSSYMPLLLATAKKHRVDARRLMLAVCAISTAEARTEVVEFCAQRLAEQGAAPAMRPLAPVRTYVGSEQEVP